MTVLLNPASSICFVVKTPSEFSAIFLIIRNFESMKSPPLIKLLLFFNYTLLKIVCKYVIYIFSVSVFVFYFLMICGRFLYWSHLVEFYSIVLYRRLPITSG